MARITGHIRAAAPAGQIFDTVADTRNEPSFNPAMTGVELLTLDGRMERRIRTGLNHQLEGGDNGACSAALSSRTWQLPVEIHQAAARVNCNGT